MKQYTVAVLGATGAVGREMIKILQERNFPVGKLVPLASARSAGKTLQFRGEDVTIQEATDSAFAGVDIVLGAAENPIAKRFAPAIVAAGAVFVDNSSAFRMDPNVPLIVPEVNPEDAAWHTHRNRSGRSLRRRDERPTARSGRISLWMARASTRSSTRPASTARRCSRSARASAR